MRTSKEARFDKFDTEKTIEANRDSGIQDARVRLATPEVMREEPEDGGSDEGDGPGDLSFAPVELDPLLKRAIPGKRSSATRKTSRPMSDTGSEITNEDEENTSDGTSQALSDAHEESDDDRQFSKELAVREKIEKTRAVRAAEATETQKKKLKVSENRLRPTTAGANQLEHKMGTLCPDIRTQASISARAKKSIASGSAGGRPMRKAGADGLTRRQQRETRDHQVQGLIED